MPWPPSIRSRSDSNARRDTDTNTFRNTNTRVNPDPYSDGNPDTNHDIWHRLLLLKSSPGPGAERDAYRNWRSIDLDAVRYRGQLPAFLASFRWELYGDTEQGRPDARLRRHHHGGCRRHSTAFSPSRHSLLECCRLTAADVSGDTAINTVDVIAIQRFFLAQTTGFANTGKYQFNPANRTYSGIASNQTGQNYDTLVLGDVASPFAE